ncbi:MAG: VWA domain-containing protein [Gemmatales bacterium]
MQAGTQTSLEFVWRRLQEPPEMFGLPLGFDPYWWLGISVPLMLLALIFVVITYRRESKTIGPKWSALLGLFRVLTYITLFFIWLLPAMRQVTHSEQQSKVAILFDVSASVTETSDIVASEEPGEQRWTRQEVLLEMLKPSAPLSPGGARKPDFIAKLLEKNPIVCYRFGEILDPQPMLIEKGKVPAFSFFSRQLMPTPLAAWNTLLATELITDLDKLAQDAGIAEQQGQSKKTKTLIEAFERGVTERRALQSRLLNRTNLGLALRDLLQKEKGGLQGVIIFSDGKSTAGSSQDLNDAVSVAKKENVPVFTVGMGAAQTIPNLRLVDVLTPHRVQPDDDFPVRVAIEGENVASGQATTVILQVERPGEKPEDLPAEQLNLIQGTGRQTRGTAEFRITNPKKIKGDWKFKARVVPLKGERTRADNVSQDAKTVRVEDRKLNVLLFASAATKEYQFVRNMLMREQDKFDFSIYLQSAQNGTVQDVDPKKILDRFPSELRAPDADPMNLGNYDVIVAFDPDWRYLLGKEDAVARGNPQEKLRSWVQDLGGGLVLVAGPVHTFNLVRDPELQVIQNLYPVIFDDSPDALHILDRSNREPWALNWDPSAGSQPYFDLTDSGEAQSVLRRLGSFL